MKKLLTMIRNAVAHEADLTRKQTNIRIQMMLTWNETFGQVMLPHG